jgi:hypothetical protein
LIALAVGYGKLPQRCGESLDKRGVIKPP